MIRRYQFVDFQLNKTSHIHQASIALSSITFIFSFCRTVELHHQHSFCLYCFPSAFCLNSGSQEFRFRAVRAKSFMASDPTSSSLNISGTSSQSVLGGAVAVRSRSASSGHSSQHSTPRKRSNRKSNPSLVGALTRIPKAKSLMPPTPARAMDFDVDEEFHPNQHVQGFPHKERLKELLMSRS